MRYQTKIDEARRAAGWGQDTWVVDTENTDEPLLRLTTADEAKEEAYRLNCVEYGEH